ncbi:Di-sulfide bridge nucleocytoplasmic transport domain-containing protein [Lipomyces japonicus]|uniref:Di-sulfide bridge nucleocytoplasmic transport domain-containing protein n=1 Tax=Lipomyces japonicus TaxID=56871 RepID=UPI0034CDF4D5
MDYGSSSSNGNFRGYETPMDWSYHAEGPIIDANSPFKAAAAASAATPNKVMPGDFSTAQHPSVMQTPLASFQEPPLQSSAFYTGRPTPFTNLYRMEQPQSPLYGRTANITDGSRAKPVTLEDDYDDDVVMASSPLVESPSPLKNNNNNNTSSNASADSKKDTPSSTSKLLKLFMGPDGSSPLQRTKQLLRKSLSPKKTRRKRYVANLDDEDNDEEEDEDDNSESDGGSDWEKQIVIKKTIMRSPRKVSSSRTLLQTESQKLKQQQQQSFQHADRVPTSSRHETLPFVFASYLQLFFNAFLMFTLIYIIITFVLTIRFDISQKILEYAAEEEVKIAACNKNYIANRCMGDQRIPHVEEACNEWEKCANRDPYAISKVKITAETLAGIVNGFIEPISYKAMLFIILLIVGSLYASAAKMPAAVHHHQAPQIQFASEQRNQQERELVLKDTKK